MIGARNLREPGARLYACASVAHFAFPRNETTALTYRAWLGFVVGRDIVGESTRCHVQASKRGEKFCGVVVDAKPGEGSSDWFQVRANEGGQYWLPQQNVRMCSGDGRCACEAEADRGAPACGVSLAASASLVPPGNTGTTVVEEA